MQRTAYNPVPRAPIAPRPEYLHRPVTAAHDAGYIVHISHRDALTIAEPDASDPDSRGWGEITLVPATSPFSETGQAEVAMDLLTALAARAEERFGPQIEADLAPGGANLAADELRGMVALRAERLRSAGTAIIEPVETAAHRLMVGLDLLIRAWSGAPTSGAPIPAELALAWADSVDRAKRYVEVEVNENYKYTLRLPFVELDASHENWWAAFGADPDADATCAIEDLAQEYVNNTTPDEGGATYAFSLDTTDHADHR